MNRTYIRTINETLFSKIFVFALLKKIVTFYYNSFLFHPNIFKKNDNLSTNNTEHKDCLAFLKAVNNSNINLIY